MHSFLLNKEIKEETLLPCYFFHGEETFLAHEFIEQLKETLISPEVQDFSVERLSLEDQSWAEIIDLARTVPFFFSPKIIVVEAQKGKRESLSTEEQKILKHYFLSPSSKTILIIIFSGKLKKSASLLGFFSSLPSSVVLVKEMRPLKGRSLFNWMDKRFHLRGKRSTAEAKARLEELTGRDLRRLSNEIEKLVTFAGEKDVVDLDDVNQASGWVKTFFEWEIADSLEKADFEQSLVVLNNLFKEGVKPEYALGSMARFCRDILMAKLLLREKESDRKAIFKELRPHIHEKLGNFYTTKFKEFFSLVEKFSMDDMNHILDELEQVDLKIKTSSLDPQVLLESFLFDYCALRKEGKVTWKTEE